jgi:hypothetical protein
MNYDYPEITLNTTNYNNIINSLQNIQPISPVNTPLIIIYIFIAIKSEILLKFLSLIHPILNFYYFFNNLYLLDIILFLISTTGLIISILSICGKKLRTLGRKKELDGVI